MKRKLNGSTTAAISMFLISGVLASFLGARQFEKHTTHEVYGINGSWPAGTSVAPEMLKKVRVNREVSGIDDARLIVGKKLDRSKKSGEVIRPNELKRPVRSWLAQQVPEGKVLYTMKPHLGSIPHSQLRNGDSFDVIATNSQGAVRAVAKDVQLIGVLADGKTSTQPGARGFLGLAMSTGHTGGSGKASLVVAVAPQYVYPLASIHHQESVSIVLHGAIAGSSGQRATIDPRPTQRHVEVMTGVQRRLIPVAIPTT
ncbi:hypothetical protein [Marinobacter fonticola]|uniref:hypothetical protein n=1 Tax=Marinobacter fonticola TaxID=2603215 RepID=UPI0011E823B6|nr:hypothetical protein [Marinobacter fonticola]